MINQSTVVFNDKANRQAIIVLNNRQIGVGYTNKPTRNGFDTVIWFQIRLANIHNQSNPIMFEARTLKGLTSKITQHKFELVKY